MITVQISDEALADLDEGFWFYEQQEAGIGDYFADQLRLDIGKLKKSAGIHPKIHKDVHRYFSDRFPYGIYYRFSNETATVVAVLDCRQDPDWIELHLRHRTSEE